MVGYARASVSAPSTDRWLGRAVLYSRPIATAGEGEMNIAAPIISAVAAIAGVALGAGLQYLTAREIEDRRSQIAFRTEIYQNFFEGQAKLNQARELEAHNNPKAQALYDEYEVLIKKARFQAGVAGDSRVVEAMVAYFDAAFGFPICKRPADIERLDAAIYRRMREDVFGGDPGQQVDDRTLFQLVQNCTLRE
jgi:hypothetical protein